MRYPFNKYKIGTKYGSKGKYWKCGFHSGQDLLSANYGGDGLIYPLYEGYVLKVTSSGSYGNCVYVQHNDGYLTLYAHMRTVYVKPGMRVDEKTALGVEGLPAMSPASTCIWRYIRGRITTRQVLTLWRSSESG